MKRKIFATIFVLLFFISTNKTYATLVPHCVKTYYVELLPVGPGGVLLPVVLWKWVCNYQ